MILTHRVAQLEKQLCISRMLSDDLVQFIYHLIIYLIRDYCDGDMVDGLFLDRLQQLHIDDFQFFLI